MPQNQNSYHVPALLSETISGLNIKPNGRYVDATFGGGGHSKAILQNLGNNGHLYGFDQDIDAMQNIPDDARFDFIHSNFKFIKNFMMYYHEDDGLDGIIADLGVSFHHFDDQSRGFAFRLDGELDMRMNTNTKLRATDIINQYSEEQLTNLFRLYGELRNAKQIAHKIVNTRQKQPIERVNQLNEIIIPFCGKDKEKKNLAQVYQSLRIEVNDELSALRKLLTSSLDLLKNGGRLCILTYHSLEDRIVKNFLKSGNLDGQIEKDFYGNPISPFRLINNKVIVASEAEIQSNPRSRSAKLRIAEKI